MRKTDCRLHQWTHPSAISHWRKELANKNRLHRGGSAAPKSVSGRYDVDRQAIGEKRPRQSKSFPNSFIRRVKSAMWRVAEKVRARGREPSWRWGRGTTCTSCTRTWDGAANDIVSVGRASMDRGWRPGDAAELRAGRHTVGGERRKGGEAFSRRMDRCPLQKEHPILTTTWSGLRPNPSQFLRCSLTEPTRAACVNVVIHGILWLGRACDLSSSCVCLECVYSGFLPKEYFCSYLLSVVSKGGRRQSHRQCCDQWYLNGVQWKQVPGT